MSPSSLSSPIRRKIILIKRTLQTKYVILVLSSVLLTVTIVALDFYYVFGKLFVKEFGDMNLAPIFKNATILLAAHLSVYLLVVVILSIFISHKFAGPVFRLEKVSEAIAKGDLTARIVLRQGDELFETAEQMNHMIISLREKIQRDLHLSVRIAEKINSIAQQSQNNQLSSEKLVNELHDILLEIKHIGSGFKL